MKKWGILMLVIWGVGVSRVMALSVGITPGSYRPERTVECIGDEANSILFYLSASNMLPYHLPELKKPVEGLLLEIQWPREAKVLGISSPQEENKRFKELVPVGSSGEFDIYHYTFSSDAIQKRLIQNAYYIRLYLWFMAPRKLDTAFRWSLKYQRKVILKTDNALKTIGTIDPVLPQAKRYQIYICQPGADCVNLPGNLMRKRIEYYHKLGLSDIEYIYSDHHRISEEAAKAMLASGLNVVGLRGGGFENLQRRYYSEKNFGPGGLIGSMDEFCQRLLGEEAKIYQEFCLPYTNQFAIDWEPGMIRDNGPGYADAPTVAAFARQNKIAEPLTPELLKSKYAKAYAEFRQEQYCRPIGAIRQFLNRYRPGTTFYVCHGSGLPWHDLDYRVFDKYADYHLPMIYTASTIDFFQRLEALTRYVSAQKLIPVTELTYYGNLNYKDLPGCVMNLLSPALAGCAGVAQWPGLPELDGGIHYAFYRTRVLLAPVIDIFQQGKNAAMKLKPLPLKENILKIGSKKIDISYPQWSSCAILRAREFNNEYAIGILNLNNKEKLYTQITIPELSGEWFLIEPERGRYVELSGESLATGVIIDTPKYSPGIWLLTQNSDKKNGMNSLPLRSVADAFNREKGKMDESNIKLGTVGKFTTAYEVIRENDHETPLLTVSNGSEKLGFTNSGGRIMSWTLNGGSNLISTANAIGGFGMDMFWLPRSGRWSGDQVADMTLKSCENDGRTVKVCFEGKLYKTLTGCSLRKVYALETGKPGVAITITLHNGNADPQNTFSYWSHNVVAFAPENCRYVVFQPDGSPADTSKLTSCYPNPSLTQAERALLGSKNHIREAVQPFFGLYGIKERTGFIFDIPRNFLMNYRFGNCADIMMKPVVLKHNQKLTVTLHVTAVHDTLREFEQIIKKGLVE